MIKQKINVYTFAYINRKSVESFFVPDITLYTTNAYCMYKQLQTLIVIKITL